MFKDYDKYLYTSMKVYLFVLILIFIMKLVGLDYFGLDINNPTLLNLNDFIMKYHLENLWYAISIYVNVYIVISITTNDNSSKLKLYVLLCMPLIVFIQVVKTNNIIFLLLDYIYVLILSIVYLIVFKRKIKKYNILNYIIFYIVINTIFQIISILIRGQEVQIYGDNFIINFIYNLDYFIMILMFQNLYFKKGIKDLCSTVVYYSLQKLTYLKKLQKKSQRKSQNKNLTKVEKITNLIYFILSIIWNALTLVCIILIGMLNDTFIECIFIMFSFWISKSVFGKAFHLKNMIHCFIVSNITYYVLNRVTTPLGISIFIPILLGVGLSYFTSKLVKKTYKPLYRGMPEDLFE